MRIHVWVDQWQQECCGESFRIGSAVTWTVSSSAMGSEWAGLLLGEEWGRAVTHHEEHHSEDEELGVVSGVVHTIYDVTCRRTRNDRAFEPVPMSGVLTPTDSAEVGDSTSQFGDDSAVTFEGWIVELDLLEARG